MDLPLYAGMNLTFKCPKCPCRIGLTHNHDKDIDEDTYDDEFPAAVAVMTA